MWRMAPTNDVRKDAESKLYSVYVDDNFHYMDKSERYKLGTFETCEEAVIACMKIVDEFLLAGYGEGKNHKQLIEEYLFFGDDPFIVSGDKKCFFSARDYASKRCNEIFGVQP